MDYRPSVIRLGNIRGRMIWVALAISWICAIATVIMARRMRHSEICLLARTMMLRELMTVVEALAHRGAIVCDICHDPIAPFVPTIVEGNAIEGWSVVHASCDALDDGAAAPVR